MKFDPTNPPRVFRVSSAPVTELAETARITLEPFEQVTFLSSEDAEYDVARMPWGYYATPSTNARLTRFGLRAALVLNTAGRCYVLLVEMHRLDLFQAWLNAEAHRVIAWLDDERDLARIAAGALAGIPGEGQ